MTSSNAQMSHLKASVVLQKKGKLGDVELSERIAEGLAVLAKAIDIFKNPHTQDGAYDVEVLVQECSIVLTGYVASRAIPALSVHLTPDEMQALFDING
jgi:hypothetical protein